jgi:hypothetical protein
VNSLRSLRGFGVQGITSSFIFLDQGYDVVSGWRKDRQDHYIKRNMPSILANKLISFVSGVQLHDFGCSLKAYKRHVVEGIRLLWRNCTAFCRFTLPGTERK